MIITPSVLVNLPVRNWSKIIKWDNYIVRVSVLDYLYFTSTRRWMQKELSAQKFRAQRKKDYRGSLSIFQAPS